MFIALYRWRVKPEAEAEFKDAWSAVTLYYRDRCGSRGSRLHRGNDGLHYAYAIWPSEEARQAAFDAVPEAILRHRETMQMSIEEQFPEVLLETLADHII